MKILLVGEFSGLQNELKNGLLQLGHEVTLAAASDFYKKYPADINLGYGDNLYNYKLRQLFYPFLNLRKLSGYDVVHIVNFYTIPRLIGLNLFFIDYLKKNNGILTLSGAGDDPFFVKYADKTMRYSPISWDEKIDRGGKSHYMRANSHLLAMHECMSVVDRVIPIMFEYYSTFLEAGYAAKTAKPIPIPINVKKYEPSYALSDKLVFFHGLNRPGFKGTFLIKEAFEKLSGNYPNDVECIIDGKMAFEDYIKVLSRTNVSVDQVFSYSLAMNALYSMAQGKVVCGGAEAESTILYDGKLPPVFNLQPSSDEIYNTLINILAQKNNLIEISNLSRNFVENHHDGLKVAQQYVDCWNSINPTISRN
jgi:hypothetical protein